MLPSLVRRSSNPAGSLINYRFHSCKNTTGQNKKPAVEQHFNWRVAAVIFVVKFVSFLARVVFFLFCLCFLQDGKVVFRCKHGKHPQYVAEANGQVHVVSEEQGEEEQRLGTEALLRNCCMMRAKSHRKKKTDWGTVANNCCRFMYPTAFILFNLIYWLALWFGWRERRRHTGRYKLLLCTSGVTPADMRWAVMKSVQQHISAVRCPHWSFQLYFILEPPFGKLTAFNWI